MRRLFLALTPFLLACPVRTAIVDANARHSKMVDARAICWDLPRETVFETVKAQVEDYRKYHISEASLEKGIVETFPREIAVPPGTPAKRHQLVVTLTTDPAKSCTKVLCSALVEYEYSRKKGFQYPEREEREYGIEYDCSLKIDAALNAVKSGAPAPTPATGDGHGHGH